LRRGRGSARIVEHVLSRALCGRTYTGEGGLTPPSLPHPGPASRGWAGAFSGSSEDAVAKTGTHKVHRDAGTGKFVPPDYAKKHPKTTVSDTVKNPKKK